MQFGQISFRNVSPHADYLQLDVCGLSKEEAVNKYMEYEMKNQGRPMKVVLHGDWTKKGCSENNLRERKSGYQSVILAMKEKTQVLGIALHPPSRKKMPLEEFTAIAYEIQENTNTPVFMENRSSKTLWLSDPDEIIAFSKKNLMTIDIPQLYIACRFDFKRLLEVLDQLCWENVKEVHMANLMRKERRTYVGRKLMDGELDIKRLIPYLRQANLITLEMLGGVNVFGEGVEGIKKLA